MYMLRTCHCLSLTSHVPSYVFVYSSDIMSVVRGVHDNAESLLQFVSSNKICTKTTTIPHEIERHSQRLTDLKDAIKESNKSSTVLSATLKAGANQMIVANTVELISTVKIVCDSGSDFKIDDDAAAAPPNGVPTYAAPNPGVVKSPINKDGILIPFNPVQNLLQVCSVSISGDKGTFASRFPTATKSTTKHFDAIVAQELFMEGRSAYGELNSASPTTSIFATPSGLALDIDSINLLTRVTESKTPVNVTEKVFMRGLSRANGQRGKKRDNDQFEETVLMPPGCEIMLSFGVDVNARQRQTYKDKVLDAAGNEWNIRYEIESIELAYITVQMTNKTGNDADYLVANQIVISKHAEGQMPMVGDNFMQQPVWVQDVSDFAIVSYPLGPSPPANEYMEIEKSLSSGSNTQCPEALVIWVNDSSEPFPNRLGSNWGLLDFADEVISSVKIEQFGTHTSDVEPWNKLFNDHVCDIRNDVDYRQMWRVWHRALLGDNNKDLSPKQISVFDHINRHNKIQVPEALSNLLANQGLLESRCVVPIRPHPCTWVANGNRGPPRYGQQIVKLRLKPFANNSYLHVLCIYASQSVIEILPGLRTAQPKYGISPLTGALQTATSTIGYQ